MSGKKTTSLRFIIFVTILFIVFSSCSQGQPVCKYDMLNVNDTKMQGDAHFIKAGKTTILIDTGMQRGSKGPLIRYLQEQKITKLNHVIITHAHRDHYGGLPDLISNNIHIDNLYMKLPSQPECDKEIPWGCDYRHVKSVYENTKKSAINYHVPSEGKIIQINDKVSLKILISRSAGYDINDQSLIIKLRVNELSVLFTGDLNKKLSRELISNPEMKADILKVPHHGAESLAVNAFFDHVGPSIMLIPAPKWIWSHERGTRLKKYATDNKIPAWINGFQGTVGIEFFNDHAKIFPGINSPAEPFILHAKSVSDS